MKPHTPDNTPKSATHVPTASTPAAHEDFAALAPPARPELPLPAAAAPYASPASLERLRQLDLFRSVSPEALEALHSSLDEYTLPVGTVISGASPERDRFHVILSGKVEFSVPDGDGHDIVVGEAGPGGFFGELEVLCGRSSGIKVRVVEEVHSLGFEPHEFEALSKAQPEIGFAVLRQTVPRIAHIDKLFAATISRNPQEEFSKSLTLGQRLADTVAKTMGSWRFILGQAGVLAAWAAWNSIPGLPHFDPYPFIFMNLALSCQAAFAAPIIMMSQNRQAAQDRVSADIDHAVNIKAELGVKEILQRLTRLEERLETHARREDAPARQDSASPLIH